jgi:hypothetical protein
VWWGRAIRSRWTEEDILRRGLARIHWLVSTRSANYGSDITYRACTGVLTVFCGTFVADDHDLRLPHAVEQAGRPDTHTSHSEGCVYRSPLPVRYSVRKHGVSYRAVCGNRSPQAASTRSRLGHSSHRPPQTTVATSQAVPAPACLPCFVLRSERRTDGLRGLSYSGCCMPLKLSRVRAPSW